MDNETQIISLKEFMERELLARNGTLEELAEVAKLPVTVIEGLMNGTQTITDDVLKGIGRIMKASVVRVWTFESEPPQIPTYH